MNTIARAKRLRFFHRIIWLVVIVAVLALLAFLTGPKFGAILEALTPPNLPKVTADKKQVWLEQNWTEQQRDKFHHMGQGTRTFPIPFDWFVNLEQPKSSPYSLLFGKKGKLVDSAYMQRFGFIRGKVSALNPYGLPIGFAATADQALPGIKERTTAVGLTCAACHTGHLVYNDTEYVIEGGPADTDLGLFRGALSAAMAQTLLSSKIPFFDGRFDRFARNVLKEKYSDTTKLQLARDFDEFITSQAAKGGDIIDVTEGFSRLDALNRIGNQVFSANLDRRKNYAPISAPVNYPHLWTASWFDWVQYDGSIMQPLVRNAGEALGVSAYLDVKSPLDEKRFGSSIPMNSLYWIENTLSGPPPYPNKKFSPARCR